MTLRARDRVTGQVRWARIKSTAVRDPDGGVRLAINVIEDITELKRSEEAQRFLAEASRRLAGSLDYERTLASVAELAVPAIADDCSLVLADRDVDAAGRARRDAVGRGVLEPHRMIVPMTAAGRVIGTITLTAFERVYDDADVLVAEDFGLRAGAAIENARLYRAASRDRGGAADLAVAAAPAGDPGRVAGRRLSPGAAGLRSAATSTTCSRPPRGSGTW